MGIVDLFSKRQKRLRGEIPDVYKYDDIPKTFLVQVVQILRDTFGDWGDGRPRSAYQKMVKILRHEYGVFRLPGPTKSANTAFEELRIFMVNQSDVEKALDGIELSFREIDETVRDWGYRDGVDMSEAADSAIEELNLRFQEHGVGYRYAEGQIIRVDSGIVHSEVVKPALALLHNRDFAGAEEEYLSAHEHYRHGRHEEALNDALKAFESTMKIICDKRRWKYPGNATAKALIDVCLKNELIPEFWQTQYSSLRTLLESGVPTGRNKLGAHGQGSFRREVPSYLVGYVLHMTAAAIVFLVEAHDKSA